MYLVPLTTVLWRKFASVIHRQSFLDLSVIFFSICPPLLCYIMLPRNARVGIYTHTLICLYYGALCNQGKNVYTQCIYDKKKIYNIYSYIYVHPGCMRYCRCLESCGRTDLHDEFLDFSIVIYIIIALHLKVNREAIRINRTLLSIFITVRIHFYKITNRPNARVCVGVHKLFLLKCANEYCVCVNFDLQFRFSLFNIVSRNVSVSQYIH